MNTRKLRWQLRTYKGFYGNIMFSLMDEIDRLERKDQVCQSMIKQLIQIQRHQDSRRKAA